MTGLIGVFHRWLSFLLTGLTFSRDYATQLYTSVTTLFPADAQRDDPILAEYVDDTGAVCRAIQAHSDGSSYLGLACTQVAATAKSAKDDCRTSLNLLSVILASYAADKLAAERLPASDGAEAAIDALITSNKTEYAKAISDRLGDIETKVAEAVKSNTGIYDLVSTETADLESILGRTPRSTKYIGGRDIQQNSAAGDEGERRAGIDPNAPKRKITILDRDDDDHSAIPDRIDDTNRQLTEVKNTNSIVDAEKQLLIEEQWARDNGYTMTLGRRTSPRSPICSRNCRRGPRCCRWSSTSAKSRQPNPEIPQYVISTVPRVDTRSRRWFR
ncbi:putative toxin [Nocardia sp. NPDC050175]|uniref:putative toxin n=1 Tax=Nocardia sp. NPDC050175 TaxID=3364317 RepID=UPI0037B024BF